MHASSRKNDIAEALQSHGYLSVKKIALLIHASEATVRRDLAGMETEGRIHRTYGGAIPSVSRQFVPLSVRSMQSTEAKEKIAREAMRCIRDDSVIFLDSSSCVLFMLRQFRENMPVTVVTNSLPVAQRTTALNIPTYVTGGMIQPSDEAIRGKYAVDFIRQFHFDTLFFSCSGMNSAGELNGYNETAITFLQTALPRCRQSVFLCTGEKIGLSFPQVICSLADIDTFVSDMPLPEGLSALLGKNRGR